jgi:hypothetical protein
MASLDPFPSKLALLFALKNGRVRFRIVCGGGLPANTGEVS